MMDYYSQFPGPSKEEAKKTIRMRTQETLSVVRQVVSLWLNNRLTALRLLC